MAEYIKVDHWGGVFSSLALDIYPPLTSFILLLCTELTQFIGRSLFLDFWLLETVKKK